MFDHNRYHTDSPFPTPSPISTSPPADADAEGAGTAGDAARPPPNAAGSIVASADADMLRERLGAVGARSSCPCSSSFIRSSCSCAMGDAAVWWWQLDPPPTMRLVTSCGDTWMCV